MIEANHYNIALLQLDGYHHSEALSDIGRLLNYSFESLGIQSRFRLNTFSPVETNIVLGYQLISDPEILAPVKTIVYQLEQLSDREGWLNETRLKTLLAAGEVWDYSEENIKFLRSKGVENVRLLSIGFHEKLQTIEPAVEDIDVLFYGSMNKRREKILRELSQHCRLKHLFGIYGKERDQYIARSKIVLNIHFYEAQIMEQVRISYLLNNRRFVLSEESKNNPYNGGIVSVPYLDLVEVTLDYLTREQDRHSIAGQGYEILRGRPQTDALLPLLNR